VVRFPTVTERTGFDAALAQHIILIHASRVRAHSHLLIH